jgi:hypothetical protein
MRINSVEEFGTVIDSPFKDLKAENVLYDFEGPRIFSSSSQIGLFLCYVVSDLPDGQAVLVTPTSLKSIENLSDGAMSVRDALTSTWSLLLKTDFDSHVLKAVNLSGHVPDKLLPKAGTMLNRSLQPFFSVKLDGEGITERNVRASVVRQALDAGTVVLKRIVDIVWNANPEGRPKNALRFLSDLPTQSFAFGSFRVDFKKPDSSQMTLVGSSMDEEFKKIGHELDRLITWASTDSPDDELEIQELRALERLVPPLSGQVDRVTLSGGILGRGAERILTRVSTQKLKRAMKSHQDEQVLLTYSGRIRELDMDALTFRLRDIVNAEKGEVLCRFEETLLTEVSERLVEEHPVTITGRQVKGVFEVSDLSIYIPRDGTSQAAQSSNGQN